MPGMNRETTGVVLPVEVSSEIWTKTIEESAVMQLSRRIELPGAGMDDHRRAGGQLGQ